MLTSGLEKISIYVVSTFDTDYILVHGEDLGRAISTLSKAGHTFAHLQTKR